jgi:hypothetical protein
MNIHLEDPDSKILPDVSFTNPTSTALPLIAESNAQMRE